MRRFSIVALVLTLAACGTASQTGNVQQVGLSQLAQRLVSLARGDAGGQGDPRSQLNRAVIDASPIPLLLVTVESEDVAGLLTRTQTNRGVVHWRGGDGSVVNLVGGVMTSTRRLRFDLISSDISDVTPLIRGRRAGQGLRIHRYIDGYNDTVIRSFTCRVVPGARERIEIFGLAYPVQRVTETCRNADLSFENQYWVGQGDGVIWQSRQWVSAETGSVFLQLLKP